MRTLVSQLSAFLPPSKRDGGTGIEAMTTLAVFRWVQEYNPEIDKRCRLYLKPTNDSWRVDEMYILVKGKQKYLDRAVDCQENTLDFLLSA